MLLSDYLKHLYWWFRMFPTFSEDTHGFCRALGEPEETCLVCGRTQIDPYFDSDADKRMMERFPDRDEED